MQLYHDVSFKTNRLITQTYSTSFSTATRLFDAQIRQAIYNIYGFVRVADEIVDSFHGFDKNYLLNKFESDFYDAQRHGISTNPVLQAFNTTVKNTVFHKIISMLLFKVCGATCTKLFTHQKPKPTIIFMVRQM